MHCTTEYFKKLINQTKTTLNEIKEFLIFLTKRAQNDTILRVASSLSYTSLLAIVPLFLIIISVFSVFPVFEALKEPIQNFLIGILAPNAEKQFIQYFSDITLTTGKFTTLGIIGLAIISIMLLSTIENSLNFIFKVNRPRRFTTKITLYWTVITLGPLLLGTAFSLRGYLYTLQEFMPENFVDNPMFLLLLPSFITLVMLILVYVLVPNKKVSISSATCGAFVAVIIFSFLRKIFTYFIAKSATYQILYGALAIIPIFLVWMYLAWAVVILGAVITAALDEFKSMSKIQLKKILISGKPEKRH
jgi:membrane protein